jgi:hypothetical protein
MYDLGGLAILIFDKANSSTSERHFRLHAEISLVNVGESKVQPSLDLFRGMGADSPRFQPQANVCTGVVCPARRSEEALTLEVGI